MIKRVPHYYKDFTCIASECKDNCCIGGWEIDIDDETADYYLNLKGEFGDRLRASIGHTDEYCFKLENGQCPFLDDHNLCEIYKELGEDKMGVVCTQFPRYTEYYGNVKETGIGLACEEAERIIFQDTCGFSLESEEIEEEPVEDLEFDDKLAEMLFRVRDYIFKILDKKDISINNKMLLMIASGKDLQEAINSNEYSLMEKVINGLKSAIDGEANSLTNYCLNIPKTENAMKDVESILCAYNELEILNDDWPDALNDVFDILHGENMEKSEYDSTVLQFMSHIKEREFEYISLLKYFVFRYFMKASYDHDVFGKLQLAVTNYFVIRDMDIVRWLKNGKSFSFNDRIDTVHIFSREVEYSEDNLEVLAEEFIFDDIFKADNLISLLRSDG